MALAGTTLRVEFEMTADDAAEWLVFQTFDAPDGRRNRVRRQFLAALGGIVATAALPFLVAGGPRSQLMLSVIGGITSVGIAACAYRLPGLRALTKLRTRRVYSRPGIRELLGHTTTVVAPEGLFRLSQRVETRYGWEGVLRVIPTPAFVFIALTELWCLGVPRRAFDTDEAMYKFAELAESYRTAAGGSS